MKRKTLSRYLIEQEREHGNIPNDLRLLLEVVSRACKLISHSVSKGALGDVLGGAGTDNVQGEAQKKLEKELIVEAVQSNKLVKGDFSPVNMDRDTLIVEYAGLIKFIAQKIAARLPANIELDDLISSGVIGLMDAIEKYDSSRDNKFKTYAEFRIRGSILDELRSQDWVPRSVREKAKVLERAYAKIEQEKALSPLLLGRVKLEVRHKPPN